MTPAPQTPNPRGVRRTTVFLTLDPDTARALQARLATLLDTQVPLHRRHRPPVILLDPADGAAPSGLPGVLPPGAALLVATAAQYEWAARAAADPGHLAAVYVRPELMVTQDVLQDLWPAGSAEADAWAELLALDRHLQHLPRVMMEDVHGGGTPLWPALAEALELPWPDGLTLPPPAGGAAAADGAAGQARALAALLPPRHLAGPLAAARPVGADVRLAVRAGGAGLRLLGQGWSFPEREFVWSDGTLATLLLPPAPPGRHVAARLRGFLIRHPARPVGLAAWMGGACLGAVAVRPEGPGEVVLDLALPATAPGRERVLELRLDGPVRPCDVGGPGDARSLGIALQEVELRDAGPAAPMPAALVPAAPAPEPVAAAALPADAPGFLRDPLVAPLFGRCRPELALVLSAALEPGLLAARACLTLGAGTVIVSRAVSDPAPDAALVAATDAGGTAVPGVALLHGGVAALPALLGGAGSVPSGGTNPALPGGTNPALPGGGSPEPGGRGAARRVGLAVLCDVAQVEPFLAACALPGGEATLAGASLVIASGNPYLVGYPICWYLREHRLLMQASDDVTLAGPPAP